MPHADDNLLYVAIYGLNLMINPSTGRQIREEVQSKLLISDSWLFTAPGMRGGLLLSNSLLMSRVKYKNEVVCHCHFFTSRNWGQRSRVPPVCLSVYPCLSRHASDIHGMMSFKVISHTRDIIHPSYILFYYLIQYFLGVFSFSFT